MFAWYCNQNTTFAKGLSDGYRHINRAGYLEQHASYSTHQSCFSTVETLGLGRPDHKEEASLSDTVFSFIERLYRVLCIKNVYL